MSDIQIGKLYRHQIPSLPYLYILGTLSDGYGRRMIKTICISQDRDNYITNIFPDELVNYYILVEDD